MSRIPLLSLLCLVLLTSCLPRQTVKVACITSLSGKLTLNSTLGMNAMEVYASGAEAAAGPVRYEIVPFDDQSDAGSLEQIVRQIEEQGIRFVIGPLPSGLVLRTRELLAGKDVLQFAPVAAVDSLAGQDDNFIKMYPSIREAAESLASFVKRQGPRKIVPVQDLSNKEYGALWIEAFSSVLAGTSELTAPVSVRNPEVIDYNQVADQILASGANAVLLILNTYDQATLCQILHNRAPGLRLISSSWAFNNQFLAETGKAAEGMIFAAAFDPESRSERYLAYQEAYQKRYRDVADELTPAYCYESLRLLDQAIQAARSTSPARVKQAILGFSSFEGLQGTVSFNQYGDAKRSFNIITIQDRRYVSLGPVD